ncbi:DUF5105 domain-containing protein [Clostridium baratii]|uniref:DUF5105 domain-containing protein n=1 Tax=Clostridium baratii TaxID=1561 RepID=UPI0005F2932A|nr:DUF5105 domain-containing protein [Clostridium baratii]KJU71569.1 hypothetical protein UC77_08575 [Clostridium baratii]MDU1855756.1 DUF5105 domain-containing protein [Clostridium baratii]MDY3206811.1 DUF5105 domain-containing protein [Clostridium baratii]STA99803.1 lipoprotein [Clostridium baratii]
MKKILALMLASVLSFTLVSCGGKKPDEVVNNFYNSLKNYNVEEIKAMVEQSEENEDPTKTQTEEEVALIKKACESVEEKVINTKVDGDNAEVEVTVTAIDGDEIMRKYIRQELSKVLTGDSEMDTKQSDEEVAKFLVDSIEDKDAKKSTQTFTIKLTKKDKEWKITNIEDIIVKTFNLNGFTNFSSFFGKK